MAEGAGGDATPDALSGRACCCALTMPEVQWLATLCEPRFAVVLVK